MKIPPDSLNQKPATVMHIDLNSCFATIEQQARRHWRGKPVGVVAYSSPKGIILAASYEAKRLGIKLGTRVYEAQAIAPNIHITETDPPKYREAHRLFKSVLEEYTDRITAKSIDEFALELDDSLAYRSGKTMEQIGYEIKQRIHEVVGEAVFCNVGIGPNRFLAKLAAGLHKPDGLDVIDAANIREIYGSLHLVDLPGINTRYSARLKLAGINNPLDILEATEQKLRFVFGGIVGTYWWLRIRGYEIDNMPSKQQQIGHQYALPKPHTYPELRAIVYKLAEKTGRRLRASEQCAFGIHLGLRFKDYTRWHVSHRLSDALVSSHDIYVAVMRLLENEAPEGRGKVTLLDLGVASLLPLRPEQLSFFADGRAVSAQRILADALDEVNNRYGEYTLQPATMLGTEKDAKDAISFGNLR